MAQQRSETSAAAEATSFLGRSLIAPELPTAVRLQRETDLALAQAEYDADPHNEQAIIWLGRRLAYLGRYRQAIDVFTNGLAIHPDSHRLLRHRGHRFMTIRRLDEAITDLERAAMLIEYVPDEIEPDGIPNARGTPTSTSHTNIHYHLGLARYLNGEFDAAAISFRRCMNFARYDDMRVATMYWLYLSLRRDGQADRAANLLSWLGDDMDVIENDDYYQLLRFYKNGVQADVAASGGDLAVDRATRGYGLAMAELLRGDTVAARTLLMAICHDTSLNWAAFGFIAAEADLARMTGQSTAPARRHRPQA